MKTKTMALVLFIAVAGSAAVRPLPVAKPTVHCVLGEPANIYALTFTPDGRRLLAGEEQLLVLKLQKEFRHADGRRRLVEEHQPRRNYQIVEWELASQKIGSRWDLLESGRIKHLTFSESGRFLTIGHSNGFVSVHDSKRRKILSFKSVEGVFGSDLHALSICETNEPHITTIVHCGIAQRRAIATGKTNIFCLNHCDSITSAGATRNGQTYLICTSKSLRISRKGTKGGWCASTSTEETKTDLDDWDELSSFEPKKFNEECPTFTHAAISDDGTRALIFEHGGHLGLFDLENDKLIKRWKGHEDGAVHTVLPFHGLNWFATGNDSGEIILWDDKGNQRALLKHKDFDTPIAALALTRDNAYLASSGERRPVVIWNLRRFIESEVVS